MRRAIEVTYVATVSALAIAQATDLRSPQLMLILGVSTFPSSIVVYILQIQLVYVLPGGFGEDKTGIAAATGLWIAGAVAQVFLFRALVRRWRRGRA